MSIGVVVIGRNEGKRLGHCLTSLAGAEAVVYVDSGSSDDSVGIATARADTVVELDSKTPFSAARARNAGVVRLRQIKTVDYVQFVDGDCELDSGWLPVAASWLERHPDVAVVCGRLRERRPEASIYNWLCDREWDGPAGMISACGGNAMMRLSCVEAVGGFRDDVIAAEDDELCVRLRGKGWKVWRLADEMGWHDANMTTFHQWWRRTTRAGYAFAQGAYLHGAKPERHFVWESRRALLWGAALPATCLAGTIVVFPWGLLLWLIYPLQFAKQVVRQTGAFSERIRLAFFQLLARIPEAIGQLKFARDRLLARQPRIIEYK